MGATGRPYKSDLTRVLVTGKVTPKFESVYRIVLAAQERGIAAIRPGVKARDVDAEARSVIEEAGFGRFFKSWPRSRHRHGYSRRPPRARAARRDDPRKPAWFSRSSPEFISPIGEASESRTTCWSRPRGFRSPHPRLRVAVGSTRFASLLSPKTTNSASERGPRGGQECRISLQKPLDVRNIHHLVRMIKNTT